MGRVVHFEIQAENPERAMAFYRTLLAWEFQKLPGPQDYWLVRTGPDDRPGINGGLLPRRGVNVGDALIAYVCTAEVTSLDQSLKSAIAGGGRIVVEKVPIPGVGWLAYAKDTEGNIFGMTQFDPKAGLPG